jgi:hypothetical protein
VGRREWREILAPMGNGFPRRRQVWWFNGRGWAELVRDSRFGHRLRTAHVLDLGID